MGCIYEENKVTMSLGEFLALRDALKFETTIKEFAEKSVSSYDNSIRDVYDIGHKALSLLNMPLKREGEQDAEADK